jgi:hypothetical protein
MRQRDDLLAFTGVLQLRRARKELEASSPIQIQMFDPRLMGVRDYRAASI